MNRRRVRPSFLLRCAVLAACLGAIFGVLELGLSTGSGVLVLAAVLLWFATESGLLPYSLRRAVVSRGRCHGGPVRSIWFVDLDEQERRARDEFHDDTRDNPTLR